MKKKITILLSALFLCCINMAYSQEREVSGKVTEEGGISLPGVSVLVKGTNIGSTTDANGNYRVRVPDNNSTLVFRFIGMITREVVVGNQTNINTSLLSDTRQLSEVVITGALGISRKAKELGYAAQIVTSEDLNVNRQTNVVNALQGKVAGVTISSTGGQPGQGASIQIRGVNSIDPRADNQPLFVVDGIVIDNSTSSFGNQAELRGMSNRAADLNPDDIETVNVLKGGAATALYGLRGANGVVVITTKSGKAGALRVSYTSSAGVEEVNKFPKMQDEYTIGYTGVYDAGSFWPTWGPKIADAKAIDPTHPDQLFDIAQDAYKTGYQFRNTVNLSGGTDKIVYSSSISQFNQEGTIPFTDYGNISAKLGTQVNFSPKFNTGFSINYINSGGRRYNADRFNESLNYWSPRWDVNDYKKPDGTMKTYGNNNPIYGAATNIFEDDVNRVISSVNFNLKPLSWLDLNYRAGLDTYSDRRERTAPGPQGVAGESVYEDNGDGFVYQNNINQRIITSTFIATAETKLSKDIGGRIRLGHDLSDQRAKFLEATGDNLTVYNYFNLSNAKTVAASNSLSERRLMGFFGELTFDFKDYLFLTLTGRNDITSTLRSPNNSFFYPSASLSYVFSDQFTLPSIIDFAKARFSYAQLGKDALPYATSTGYGLYSGFQSGNTGFTRSSLIGDPSLRPEFTDTYEGGIQMQFLKNRLGFDAAYYYSLSKDQIIQANISSATGYVRASLNSGSMRNQGIELTLNGTPIQTKDFSWHLNLNFSANRNKILSIKEGLTEIALGSQFGYASSTVTAKLIPGNAYGDLFGQAYKRYYPTGTTGPKYAKDANAPIIIGADGFPTRVSNQLIANSLPRWIGALSSNFSYKNFTVTALIDTRQGQYKYNQMDNFFAAFGKAEYTENRDQTIVFEGVLADGTPNTKAVFLGQGIGPDKVNYGNGYYRNTYRGISENFIEDASWIRLRSLGLNYNLPAKLLGNSFIKNANVTLTGNNLFLITDYKGYDPETSSTPSNSNVSGFSGFTYPASRSFLFSLNVGF